MSDLPEAIVPKNAPSGTPSRPDPMRCLTAAEVAERAPEGWAQIMGRLKARYRTSDFATGLRLVNLIGESAERWDHHPDVTLTYRDVVVTLVSHDVNGLTSRDIRMSGLIAEHAKALGLEPDVAGNRDGMGTPQGR